MRVGEAPSAMRGEHKYREPEDVVKQCFCHSTVPTKPNCQIIVMAVQNFCNKK
jgi:hypothetical protein